MREVKGLGTKVRMVGKIWGTGLVRFCRAWGLIIGLVFGVTGLAGFVHF